MIPVDQTEFSSNGNCLQAAVASLFELALEEVPDLRGDALTQLRALERWANEQGLEVIRDHRTASHGPKIYCGFYIASGYTSRGTRHAVVYKDGKLVHDPHPSREGFRDAEDESTTFVPLDIARWKKGV